MPFISKEEYKRLQKCTVEVHDLKTEHKTEVKRLNKKIKDMEAQHEEDVSEIKVLTSLKNDAVKVKTDKLKNEEKEKLLKTREEALDAREEAADLEDTKKYKSGYEDGVADGLRKGYELTADDRQNMASIAALAAASHSDGATQKIAEEIVVGMEKNRAAKQLSAGSKKKS